MSHRSGTLLLSFFFALLAVGCTGLAFFLASGTGTFESYGWKRSLKSEQGRSTLALFCLVFAWLALRRSIREFRARPARSTG